MSFTAEWHDLMARGCCISLTMQRLESVYPQYSASVTLPSSLMLHVTLLLVMLLWTLLSSVHASKVSLLTFQHGSVALTAGLGQKCTVAVLKVTGVMLHVKHLNDVTGVKTWGTLCDSDRRGAQACSHLQSAKPPFNYRLFYKHSDPSFQWLLAAHSEKFFMITIRVTEIPPLACPSRFLLHMLLHTDLYYPVTTHCDFSCFVL